MTNLTNKGKRGIKMIIVKSTTAKGKRLVEIGTKYEGTWLHQVYDKWSNAKQVA